ncbi:MAG: endonuclease domain-containing protein [Actinomycetota bacterium]
MSTAAPQDGLLTTGQARAAGSSPSAISRRVATGRWRWVLPGVLDLAGLPVTGRRRWRAALLWAGPGAALCRGTAAKLWDLVEEEGEIVEICVPRRKQSPAPWLHVRHRPRLEVGHTRSIEGMLVTDVHLTLVELGSVVQADQLEDAVHAAIARGLTSSAYLLKRLDGYAARGRKGVTVLREVLADIDRWGGVSMTRFERDLFRVLRRARLPTPTPQYHIADDDGWAARPDFAYTEHRVAIEAFSFRWHGNKARSAEDTYRRARLAAMGWTVIEVVWEHLVEHPEEVAGIIAKTLGVRTLFTDA